MKIMRLIGQTSEEYEYALANLKVGDMPQTSYVGGLTIKPIEGFGYKVFIDGMITTIQIGVLILVRLKVMQIENKYGKLHLMVS